jgi:pimeloyl-ACP methyl ester carboxylesterase
MAAHVADLIAVLDYVGVPAAVFVGHSMGAYLVARFAAEHPERAARLLLLDAGLPFPLPDDPSELLDAAVANSAMRLAITFPSRERYIEGWRAHPAFSRAWDEDIAAYAHYDLVEVRGAVRCSASAAAVRTDSTEMVLDDANRMALSRVRVAARLLRAERGLFDDDPLIPTDALMAFAAGHPSVQIDEVPDVNHYTLVMGRGPGPRTVAAAIAASCESSRSGGPLGRHQFRESDAAPVPSQTSPSHAQRSLARFLPYSSNAMRRTYMSRLLAAGQIPELDTSAGDMRRVA